MRYVCIQYQGHAWAVVEKKNSASPLQTAFIIYFFIQILILPQAPIAEDPWYNKRNVQKYGRPCPQLGLLSKLTERERSEQDVEDCLHLSVYSGDV